MPISKLHSIQIDGLTIYIHPNVHSPKEYPESAWLASDYDSGASDSDSGSRSGSGHVYGVDINPDAVETTRKKTLKPTITMATSASVTSTRVSKEKRSVFDYIFWNHPRRHGRDDNEEEESSSHSEKYLDEGYKALEVYLGRGKNYLKPNGRILLGTSSFSQNDVENIADRHSYTVEVEAQNVETLHDGTEEEYLILRFD
ncbi:hypothetical protein BGZ94_006723 [Podila epigama]|nr:hypothetical protein BGZ94_006723 [Podila epigama]